MYTWNCKKKGALTDREIKTIVRAMGNLSYAVFLFHPLLRFNSMTFRYTFTDIICYNAYLLYIKLKHTEI